MAVAPWSSTMPAMKPLYLFIAAAALLASPACKKQSTTDKVKDGINDALDRRPGEKVRDAAEDATDAIKEAGKDAKDALKDATNK